MWPLGLCCVSVQFKKLFDASDPQKSKLPPRWEAKKLTLLQRMCILRCLRPAKITLAVQVRYCDSLSGSPHLSTSWLVLRRGRGEGVGLV